MMILGITGGIGSGKSTVAKYLSEMLKCNIIDADKLSKEAVSDDAVILAIKENFGEEYFDLKGEYDRKKMASLIFANEEKRKLLNSIIHPYVRKRFYELCELFKNNSEKFVVYECPLLIECGWFEDVDHLIVVYSPIEIRIRNLMDRDNMTEIEVMNRINSQISLDEKIKYADTVIYNCSDLNDLKIITEKYSMEVLLNDF